MRRLVGLHIRFHHHHNIEHLSQGLMPERPLVYVGLYLFINRRRLQIGRRDIPIVEFLAILATGSTPCIRASIGKIQRRILPPLRH